MGSEKGKTMPVIGNKVLDATIWVVFEFVMAVVYGIVLIFLGHWITGANPKYFYQRVPNLHTEIACYADSFHPMIHIKAWDNQIKKRSHWFGFLSFYGLQVVTGIVAYWIQRVFIYEANSTRDQQGNIVLGFDEGKLSTSILHHQVISFFLCTSLDTWTGDGWTNATGSAKSFFLIFVSWVLWLFKRETYQYHAQDLSNPVMNNFHVVYSIMTSIVLVNLMWCSILSPMDWNKMKHCRPGWERLGTFGPIICIAGLVQWVIMFGISYRVFPETRGYFIKTAEGAWTLLCYSWYGLTIVGAHISPHLWPALEQKIKSQAGLWVTYLFICAAFGVGFSAAIYYMYVKFLDPVFIQKIIGADTSGIGDYCRPGYLFIFGAANIIFTYQMMKAHVAQHNQHDESSHAIEEGYPAPLKKDDDYAVREETVIATETAAEQ